MKSQRLYSRRQFLGSAVAAAGLMAVLPSCRRATSTEDPNVAYYTCTMHPSVHEAEPGNCPICGMELVPVYKKKGAAPDDGSDLAATAFSVSPARQQMIGVTYATAKRSALRKTVRAVGTVDSELQRHWDCVSRVDGYVRDLAVTSEGEPVDLGQALLTLYSPELLASEREWVNALAARDEARRTQLTDAIADAEQLVTAGRRRLELLDVDDREIDALEHSRQPSDIVTYYSPAAGLVENILIHQGGGVRAGDHMIHLVDISTVWVWVQFYQEELPLVHSGMPVEITLPAQPGATFRGRIGPTDPFLDTADRTARVRVEVENPRLALHPGMYVDVALAVDGGSALTIPFAAVLPTGQRTLVFVDRGAGSLEPREVELGGKFGDDVVVLSGLNAGDRVVSSANFLIDAEAKVQGALKSW